MQLGYAQESVTLGRALSQADEQRRESDMWQSFQPSCMSRLGLLKQQSAPCDKSRAMIGQRLATQLNSSATRI